MHIEIKFVIVRQNYGEVDKYIEMKLSHDNTTITFDITNSDDKDDIIDNLKKVAEELTLINLNN